MDAINTRNLLISFLKNLLENKVSENYKRKAIMLSMTEPDLREWHIPEGK